ncbi:MAG: ABC transporter permease [Bacteroidales bacterium]|nr:ABC transporter permease [Bacteroidales bacterium]MDD4067681.1 ABC transporter permease [Bacteroidales bacterium]MDD4739174.1 ABC transporter permease [Bacteroidales bacterium]
MLNFILKRIGYGLLVLFGVITLVFFLFNILPGDSARMMLGQRADEKSVEIIKKDLGLDKPLYIQYLCYLNDLSPISFHSLNPESAVYLDKDKYSFATIVKTQNTSIVIKKPYLRRSYQSKRQVSEILSEAFPNTIILAVVSMSFALIVGVLLGSLSAIFNGSWFDKINLSVIVLGMSLPSFFAAIIFAWLFAFILAPYTGLSMFGSLYAVDDLGQGQYLALKNLILPAFTLGIRPLAVISELTKSSLLDTLSQDYIRTARAKGLGKYKVIKNHALKNSMNPVITSVSGWFASLMAGAVFVEYIFDWKGVGVVIVDGLEKYDFPVVMGALLVICVLLVIINIVVDILYGVLDPRVRVMG